MTKTIHGQFVLLPLSILVRWLPILVNRYWQLSLVDPRSSIVIVNCQLLSIVTRQQLSILNCQSSTVTRQQLSLVVNYPLSLLSLVDPRLCSRRLSTMAVFLVDSFPRKENEFGRERKEQHLCGILRDGSNTAHAVKELKAASHLNPNPDIVDCHFCRILQSGLWYSESDTAHAVKILKATHLNPTSNIVDRHLCRILRDSATHLNPDPNVSYSIILSQPAQKETTTEGKKHGDRLSVVNFSFLIVGRLSIVRCQLLIVNCSLPIIVHRCLSSVLVVYYDFICLSIRLFLVYYNSVCWSSILMIAIADRPPSVGFYFSVWMCRVVGSLGLR